MREPAACRDAACDMSDLLDCIAVVSIGAHSSFVPSGGPLSPPTGPLPKGSRCIRGERPNAYTYEDGQFLDQGVTHVSTVTYQRGRRSQAGPVSDKTERLSKAWVPGGQTMAKILVLQIHPRSVWKCVCAAHIQAGLATAGRGAVQSVREGAVPRWHSLPILLAACRARGPVSPTNGQQMINAMIAEFGDHGIYLELLCRGGRI